MNALRRYSELLAPYRKRYLVGFGLLVVTNLLVLAVPLLIKVAVDDFEAVSKGLLAREDAYFAIVAMVVVGLLMLVVRTASRVIILSTGRHLGRDLKARLYNRLLRAAPSFFARFQTGDIMSRCTSDLQLLQAVGSPGILYTLEGSLIMIMALPLMFSVSPLLAVLVLIPYPLLAVVTMVSATKVKGFSRRAQEAMAELTTHLQETLEGMTVVKAFTLEDVRTKRFEVANDRFLTERMKEAATAGAISVTAVIAAGFGICVILYFGGQEVAAKRLSYGDLALFLTLNAQILRPTIYLGWVLSLGQRALAALDRVDEILDAPDALPVLDVPEGRGKLHGALEVCGLSFRYPTAGEDAERRLALEDVSFKLPAGGFLGITGRIGSGKSTLLRAIPRFANSPANTVRVDGIPVERWDLSDLRRGIGYVPQDGAVFSLTLGENVAYGRPDASPKETMAAAAAAELVKDLDQLEAGLETVVGERGVTLSGGQRQRLAIARAILIEPKVLLLDDALSMVDSETAVAILAHLRRALPDAT
ncbi:MAG: ABC transporter ATP-binding protein [Planctomycetes bacterium]|nr:ABC transporter ATP-binding protein [Planctomycetota bacterium]